LDNLDYSVRIVHPEGTPSRPVTSQEAELLLTNVPVAATPLTQLYVYDDDGVVLNKAFI
jgi:hypothetical protein